MHFVTWALRAGVLALALSCGSSSRATPAEPAVLVADNEDAKRANWIVLQVGRVQARSTRVNGSTWDGVAEKSASGCGLIGLLGKAVGGPVAGTVATLL